MPISPVCLTACLFWYCVEQNEYPTSWNFTKARITTPCGSDGKGILSDHAPVVVPCWKSGMLAFHWMSTPDFPSCTFKFVPFADNTGPLSHANAKYNFELRVLKDFNMENDYIRLEFDPATERPEEYTSKYVNSIYPRKDVTVTLTTGRSISLFRGDSMFINAVPAK